MLDSIVGDFLKAPRPSALESTEQTNHTHDDNRVVKHSRGSRSSSNSTRMLYLQTQSLGKNLAKQTSETREIEGCYTHAECHTTKNQLKHPNTARRHDVDPRHDRTVHS